jgi:hypothetical protein
MPFTEPRPSAHLSRRQRDIARIRRATEAAQAAAKPAMAVALAQISAAFDEAASVNAFKIRIERLIRLDPHHPALRARFGARARMLRGRDLGTAIAVVERWWREERKAFAIASALGCATRLSLEVLGELRLILRVMRWKRMQPDYESIVAALCEAPFAAAAAE